MTARVRFVLFAAVALVLAGPALLFFLGRLVFSNDALLLDHVAERRTPLVELSLWAGADPNYRDDDGRSALPRGRRACRLGRSSRCSWKPAPIQMPARRTASLPRPWLPAAAMPWFWRCCWTPAPTRTPGANPASRSWCQPRLQAMPRSCGCCWTPALTPTRLAEQDLSVLAIAVDRGNTEVVRLLLAAGADPNGPGIAELVQKVRPRRPARAARGRGAHGRSAVHPGRTGLERPRQHRHVHRGHALHLHPRLRLLAATAAVACRSSSASCTLPE